jgi:hypothetical protein
MLSSHTATVESVGSYKNSKQIELNEEQSKTKSTINTIKLLS